jgi:hypothetical protein
MFTKDLIICVAFALAVVPVWGHSYDPMAGLDAVWHTKVSGCNPGHINNWTCVPCSHFPAPTIARAVVNETTNAQGYVAYWNSTNEIWAVFRGTRGILNWIYDFDAILVPYGPCLAQTGAPRCNVHQGFLEMYQSLNHTVLSFVLELMNEYPSAKVRVAGHSLGAAIATHAAVQLSLTLPPGSLSSFHTIGSPRVGDPVFAHWAASLLESVPSFRLTHQQDLVPKAPLIELGFLHIPHEVWYPYGHNNTDPASDAPNKVYHACEDSGRYEDMRGSNSIVIEDVVLGDHDYIMGVHLACNDGR